MWLLFLLITSTSPDPILLMALNEECDGMFGAEEKANFSAAEESGMGEEGGRRQYSEDERMAWDECFQKYETNYRTYFDPHHEIYAPGSPASFEQHGEDWDFEFAEAKDICENSSHK